MVLFILACLILNQPAAAEGLELVVESVQKKDLPDDFPFHMLNKNFAVLKIVIRNNSKETWSLRLEETQAYSKKGKEIERALSTDIAPEIVELYTRTSRGVHGEGYYGRRPSTYEMSRAPTVQTAPGVRAVSASIGEEIRALVEKFEIQDQDIEPGQAISGYYYLKSKKSGRELAGGRFKAGNLIAGF